VMTSNRVRIGSTTDDQQRSSARQLYPPIAVAVAAPPFPPADSCGAAATSKVGLLKEQRVLLQTNTWNRALCRDERGPWTILGKR
jgi:hypothetical protein